MNKYAVFYNSAELSSQYPNGQRLTDAMSLDDAFAIAAQLNGEYQDTEYKVRVVEANNKVKRTHETIH